MKTVTAYKLFRQDKRGNLFPLFIGKRKATETGVWLEAEHLPTKGFADRMGWHAGILPMAPHLRTKAGYRAKNRVWCEVEIPEDRAYRFETSKMQGGAWIIGEAIYVSHVLTNMQILNILYDAGISEQEAIRECI